MFDLLKKVIEGQSPTLKRFRFKDNRGMATDNITIVCLENLPFKDIDCLIDADTFNETLKGLTNPEIVQRDNLLIISEGNQESELSTEPISDLLNIEKQPEGEEIDAGNLLEAITALKPFGSNVLYATKGYLYFGHEHTVARTAITTKFKSDLVFITAEIAALLLMAKSPILKILESDHSLTFFFEFGWIETGKPNWKMPANLAEFFDINKFSEAKLEGLEPDLSKALTRICNLAKKDELVDFDETTGIQLVQGTSKRHQIKHPMMGRRVYPQYLGPVLGLDASFDFTTTPQNIPFKAKTIDGYIACAVKK